MTALEPGSQDFTRQRLPLREWEAKHRAASAEACLSSMMHYFCTDTRSEQVIQSNRRMAINGKMENNTLSNHFLGPCKDVVDGCRVRR